MTLAKGTPTIVRGSDQMFSTIYEGNGGGQRVGNFIPFTDNGTISNSVIFNYDEAHILDKTFGSAGTSRKKYTFSVWCKLGQKLDEERRIIMVGPAGNDDGFRFNDDSTIHIWQNGIVDSRLYTNRTFEDTSKWYHFVMAVDSTQATAANRVKFYVDGDQITSFSTEVYPSQDYQGHVGNNQEHTWGAASGNQEPYDGYMAEINYVDGTAYGPETFGVTDTSTGRWVPKSLSGISYGSHGYRLKFQDSSALGDDTSGNGNDFSASNFASGDYTTDSPTQNFATLSPNFSGTIGFDEGNLKHTQTLSNNYQTGYVGKSVSSGKWYFEITATSVPTFFLIGLTTLEGYVNAKTTYVGDNAGSYSMQFYPGNNDQVYYEGSNFAYGSGSSLSNGNIIGVAYDADTGAYWLAVNNTYIHSGNPSNGTSPTFVAENGAKKPIYFGLSTYNGGVFDYNFGQKTLSYTPPTDFKLLQQDNFPETSKGVPGLVWIKNRDATDSHQVYDSSRGPQLDFQSDGYAVESTTTDGLQKFIKGGCAIEDDVSINTAAESYVAWNWVANGGTTSANSDGSGATLASTIQANQTAGFSIVTYTGNATAGAKVAHGLSQAPDWLWFKGRSIGTGNLIYHHKNTAAPETDYLALHTTDATFDAQFLNDTAPDAKCFTIGGNGQAVNNNSETYVAYCWHEVPGYSKFGSYTGNGNNNGPFINTGFKPSWVMVKQTNTGNYWAVYDNTRKTFNPNTRRLAPNYNYVEDDRAEGAAGSNAMDFVSNGIKMRGNDTTSNQSGGTYVYWAFAQHPFLGDGVNPSTAK